MRRTIARLLSRFSPCSRGCGRRKSPASSPSRERMAPVRSRVPTGCRARSRCRGRANPRRGSCRRCAPRRNTRSAVRRSGARRARGGASAETTRSARGSAPFPRARDPPSRRASPRSASRGRRGAGSRGRRGRRRGGAASPRTHGARTRVGRRHLGASGRRGRAVAGARNLPAALPAGRGCAPPLGPTGNARGPGAVSAAEKISGGR